LGSLAKGDIATEMNDQLFIIGLAIRELPAGPGFELRLDRESQCGAVDGDKIEKTLIWGAYGLRV
jgi:hypothetical protein